jgi:RND family efflux transporter MFP subunit
MLGRFLAVVALAATLLARASASEPVLASGLLTPLHEIEIGTELRGTIAWLADEGASVPAGQPLVKLRDTIERLEVNLRKAQLEAARYTMDRFKKDYESAQRLHAQGIVREEELRAKQLDYLIAQSQVEQADAQLQLAHEQVALKTVSAPTNCVVSKHLKHVGEALVVTAGVEKIMRVVHIDSLYFVAYPDAKYVRRIQVGQKAEVHVPLLGATRFPGEVVFVDPAVDANSGGFRVKVLVKNPDHKIPPGLHGTVTFGGDGK